MAFIQVNMMSRCLFRTVNVNVIIPADKIQVPDPRGNEAFAVLDKFKTLYLLHGICGSQVDWLNNTKLQLWAEEKNLAVVMPAGDNRFYVDQPETNDYYGMFIGQELVEVTRRMFPLSRRKEDTYIGGLSMGGYGALRNGLLNYDTFGGIAALSTANVADESARQLPFLPESYYRCIFGSGEEIRKRSNDIHDLIRRNAAEGKTDQKIFLACGRDDSLLEGSHLLRDEFSEYGYDVTYIETPGGHEWDFWNARIRDVIDWMPLFHSAQGLSSGHVGDL